MTGLIGGIRGQTAILRGENGVDQDHTDRIRGHCHTGGRLHAPACEVLKRVGSVHDEPELAQLKEQARAWIENCGQTTLFPTMAQATETLTLSGTDGAKGHRLDEALVARTESLLGIKGYCTNIPQAALSDAGVINRYHDLWNAEKAFRMAKSDLAIRPIFHFDAQAIRVHLLRCPGPRHRTGRRKISTPSRRHPLAHYRCPAVPSETFLRAPITSEAGQILSVLGVPYSLVQVGGRGTPPFDFAQGDTCLPFPLSPPPPPPPFSLPRWCAPRRC